MVTWVYQLTHCDVLYNIYMILNPSSNNFYSTPLTLYDSAPGFFSLVPHSLYVTRPISNLRPLI